MAHVPAIQKAGMHEASRIAQAIMQREATMAMLAAAGERIDRQKAEKLPPATRSQRTRDAPDDRRHRERRPDREGHAHDDGPGAQIDLSA